MNVDGGNDKPNAFWHPMNQKQPTTLTLHCSREREVLPSVALISMDQQDATTKEDGKPESPRGAHPHSVCPPFGALPRN